MKISSLSIGSGAVGPGAVGSGIMKPDYQFQLEVPGTNTLNPFC